MDDESYIDALIVCLENNYPYPLTVALLAMVTEDFDEDDTELLEAAWFQWRRTMMGDWNDKQRFKLAVNVITGEGVVFCDDCNDLVWGDLTTEVKGNRRVCDDKCADEYITCYSCDEQVPTSNTTYESGNDWCEDCHSEYFSWCDECESSYHTDDEAEHDHSGCDCEAPHRRFTFPANGDGSVKQNERLTVELPKGTIDDEGLNRIKNLLYETLYPQIYFEQAVSVVDSIGPEWQGKRGNFTKRLSRAFATLPLPEGNEPIRLPEGLISEIGNLARQHSSAEATWHVEFTRDLNGRASEFCHSESCWWGGYSNSRCALKKWGGIGMRTYSPDCERRFPSGRIWVQPLNMLMQPTHDALNAHAYVIYNGYGNLSGYTAARIIAHLASKTYRKIQFSASPLYVNNDTGYLVADEATCKATERIYFEYDEHNEQDANDHTYLKAAA